MGTFPEAEARIFKNIYICRKCEAKNRVPGQKVLMGVASCRKCGSKSLRSLRRK